jgi:hypothetical protein
MEPSSTFLRRTGALLTTIALIASSFVAPASARGFVGAARVQLPHVVPRAIVPHANVQMPAPHRDLANPGSVRRSSDAVIEPYRHRHRFQGAGIGLWNSPVYSYSGDTGQPSLPQLAAADDNFEPAAVPFERPACVRPLIIHLKPVQRFSRLPRVIYGRPLVC